MTESQAKFIIQSYQAQHPDASLKDFQQALEFATLDPTLSDWLANEYQFDQAFSQALLQVALPPDLKQHIHQCLLAHRDGIASTSTPELDQPWIHALKSLPTPSDLRDRCLSRKSPEKPEIAVLEPLKHRSRWHKLRLPLAAVATLTMGLFFLPLPQAHSQRLPIDLVQSQLIQTYQASDPHEAPEQDSQLLLTSLKAQNLPCPCCLPAGLSKTKGISCQQWDVNGTKGSILCFHCCCNGLIRMAVFKSEDIHGTFPNRDHAQLSQNGRWSTAVWQENDHVVILTCESNLQNLAKLF